jgi:hypothetical protein
MDPNTAAFVSIFQRQSTESLIENMSATVTLETINGKAIPISIAKGSQRPNHYFVSPVAAYIDYPLDGIRRAEASKPSLKLKALRVAVGLARPLLRWSGLDDQVQLNNWMLSTCPAPELTASELRDLVNRLIKKHPTKAVVMRSLNVICDLEQMNTLKELGFVLLPARRIFIQVLEPGGAMPRNLKRDRTFARKSELSVKPGTTFSDADFLRAKELYDALYIEKYSTQNPKYTAAFLKEMCAAGVLEITGLTTPSGDLVAWVGNFCANGTLCVPIGGYDTSFPKSAGLYRVMSWLSNECAIERGLRFNMSSGAAQFKQQRGAVQSLEYTAVYVGHRSFVNRAVVRLLAIALSPLTRGAGSKDD